MYASHGDKSDTECWIHDMKTGEYATITEGELRPIVSYFVRVCSVVQNAYVSRIQLQSIFLSTSCGMWTRKKLVRPKFITK